MTASIDPPEPRRPTLGHRTHPHGIVVEVQVVPNASRNEVVGVHGTRLRVRVTAPPERGRANKAVAKLLGTFFETRADLLSGATSKVKRYLLRGVTIDSVTERMRGVGP